MQKIPTVQRRAVEKRFPRFAESVGSARLTDAPVETSLDEFVSEDMALVYACLWLAYSDGVNVTFTAPPKRP